MPHDIFRRGRPVTLSMGDRFGPWLCVVWLVIGTALGVVPPVAAQGPPPELSIDQLHIFVMPEGDHLVISEHYLLGNAGATAYVGSTVGEATVIFTLPAGAADVHPGDENDPAERYEIGVNSAGDTTVADTQPVPPGTGTSDVRISYSLPLSPGEVIRREVPLPANSCVLLIGGDLWQLEGSALISFGAMDVGGEAARAYTLDPLAAGDTFSFSVVQAPAEMEQPTDMPASVAGEPAGVGTGVGILVLGAAVVAAYALSRQDRVPALPESLRDDIVALVELDDRYGAGGVAETEYQIRREALKARLRRRLQSSSDDD